MRTKLHWSSKLTGLLWRALSTVSSSETTSMISRGIAFAPACAAMLPTPIMC
ncbi:hypothetical protein PR003_g7754 [Phytophthora rubi]|uniref:RxLR effector protein n=1 Tax=Phytophthora rubi TaxID=129364 RepID=A0A6A4B7H2_9STRA|nr:hypothetical protein PR002_g22913 [Phytophthora rubi]KAE9266551.1 hypothetical protein PR003_g32087 [Phytophthora rubi]KAE9345814.1 hypothetical protein PR003_g7754 [Phytophthora rubi]